MAVVALGGGLLAALGWWALSGGIYGCTPRDERFADTLADSRILDQHPTGALADGDRYTGCDEDDGFAVAGQYYQPGGDRASIVAFYRAAAVADGWILLEATDDPVPNEGLVGSASVLCFSKPVEDTTGYFSLWFPADLGETGDQYAVQVRGSYDGDAWC